ncbi:MAG: hypothetical protein ACQERI_06995 [Candidatus Krumholzibacteriota bacterium]
MRIIPETAAGMERAFRLSGLFFLLLFTIQISAGCSDDEITTGQAPVISSVTPENAWMGDTITVEGELFAGDPFKNRLVFSPGNFSSKEIRSYAMPLEGGSGTLKAVVPDGAFAGNIRVEKIHPLNGGYPVNGGNIYLPTTFRPFRVNLRAGDVAKAFFSSSDSDFKLNTGGLKEHLIMIFCNSVPPLVSTEYSFIISLEEELMATGSSSGSGTAAGEVIPLDDCRQDNTRARTVRSFGTAATGFDRKKREELEELLGYSRGQNLSQGESTESAIYGKASAPASVSFDVFSDYNGSLTDPASFTTVDADLKYEGDHTLLYLDSSTYGAAISDAEAEEIGRRFDQDPGSIYQTDRQTFGEESDINGDGRVAILMTPVVNRLTPAGGNFYIGGFFMPGDLLPSFVPSGCTNGMEIFYTLVPDSAGVYGFSVPKSVAIPVIKSTLAHEFLHMIMFNQRVLKYSSGMGPYYLEDLWLEEGLAHIAESANDYWSGNLTNSNLFLSEPSSVSLIYDEDDIENRGAAFLFLRYLADIYGEGIFRELVQSKKSGAGNVRAATGDEFIDLFSEWYAALYLSGKGITADPRFQFPTLHEFAFREVARDSIYELESYYGNVKSYGSSLIKVNLPADSEKRIEIRSSDDGRMNAIIIRLQ